MHPLAEDLQAAGRSHEPLRQLPASIEAEKSLLSCLLQSPDQKLGLVIERTKGEPDIFHHPHHRNLFEFLRDCYNQNIPREFVAITQSLVDLKKLDSIGGIAYLTELYDFAPTTAHTEFYLNTLKDKSTLRNLITTCTECIEQVYENPSEVSILVDQVEQKVLAVRESQHTNKEQKLNELIAAALKEIQENMNRGDGLAGIGTGYKKLDSMTGGLKPGEIFVIAARPSMGKTSLVMNIVQHVILDQRLPVGVFSLEMSTQSLIVRMLCAIARIDAKILRSGMGTKVLPKKLINASGKLSNSKLFIDDTPSLSITELRAKARRMAKQHNIAMIAIDYLQLMRSTSRKSQDNRQQEVAEISSGLKALAKELNIPIIVLAQLNRNVEQRTGKAAGRPRLSDLRESGAIEQDADIVGLLVRSAYYANDEEEREELAGHAELIIAKHRNGETGSIPLTFLEQYMRFEDRAPEPEHH